MKTWTRVVLFNLALTAAIANELKPQGPFRRGQQTYT